MTIGQTAALLCGAAGKQTTKPRIRVAAGGLPSGRGRPMAQLATKRVLSSIGMKSSFPALTSDTTRAGMGPWRMHSSLGIRFRTSDRKPQRKRLHRADKEHRKVLRTARPRQKRACFLRFVPFGFRDITKANARCCESWSSRTGGQIGPDPSASTLLRDGLHEEKASVSDSTDANELER